MARSRELLHADGPLLATIASRPVHAMVRAELFDDRRTAALLRGPAPDEILDAPGRHGREVGPVVQEESR